MPARYRFSSFVYRVVYEIDAAADNFFLMRELPWGDAGFIKRLTRFSPYTVVGQVAFDYLNMFWREDMDENPETWLEDERLDLLYGDFAFYNISIISFKSYCRKRRIRYDDESDHLIDWFNSHEPQFTKLFECYSDEVEHILFANRSFLLRFHTALAQFLVSGERPPEAPSTPIKRVTIPRWAKSAAYHRDHGRCVFCNVDLTGVVDLNKSEHFDHIVSLKSGGVNDPTNLQLTCRRCNLKKSRRSYTECHYPEWWPKD